MQTTATAELRDRLKKYPVAEIAKLAKLETDKVASFMDGGDFVSLDDLTKLNFAEVALRNKGNDCNCPACTLTRLANQIGDDSKVTRLPGMGLMIEISSRPKEPEATKPETPEPATKPTLLQRLKRVFE